MSAGNRAITVTGEECSNWCAARSVV